MIFWKEAKMEFGKLEVRLEITDPATPQQLQDAINQLRNANRLIDNAFRVVMEDAGSVALELPR